MVDRLKELLQRIQEWWNKFTAKQKTIIISVSAGVILALAMPRDGVLVVENFTLSRLVVLIEVLPSPLISFPTSSYSLSPKSITYHSVREMIPMVSNFL